MTKAHTVSRRMILGALLGAAAGPALAESPFRSIRPVPRPRSGSQGAVQGPGLDALVQAARLGGAVSLAVADAATGQMIEGLDEGRTLPPASCIKALTTLFALDRLGPDHRWTTRALATGPISGNTVRGDLILAGSGDPTLTTDGLGDLAARLAARGVRGVTGRFLVYAGGLPQVPFIDSDQPEYVGYNPSISGLNLNFNRVHFEWKRAQDGWNLTMDARGERFVPPVSMATMRTANRESPLFTYRRGEGTDNWTVASAALGKGGARWLPVRQPEVYAGEVFRTLAAAQGIRLPSPDITRAVPQGTVLAELPSDTLAPVARDMLRHSTNLTAEVVGLTASGAPSLAASARAMEDWARSRHGAEGRFVDHSGLGGDARLAAGQMVRALAGGRGSGLPGLLRDFGMRNAEGEAIKGHPVRVVAKTGTLNFASGLVGYIQPPSGRDLVFAIFCADVPRRDRLSMSEREQPEGGSQWTRRARGLQARLVGRWGALVA